MGISKKRMFCEEDMAMVLAERKTPNHVLHLLLSLLTAGLWIPVWLVLTLVAAGAYRCPKCGGKTLSYIPKKYRDEIDTRRMLRE